MHHILQSWPALVCLFLPLVLALLRCFPWRVHAAALPPLLFSSPSYENVTRRHTLWFEDNDNVKLHGRKEAVIIFLRRAEGLRKCGSDVFEMSSSLILRCCGALTHSATSTWDRCQFHDPVMACGVIFGRMQMVKGGTVCSATLVA